MKSLGSYTLGDQYVSPERRLSAMLTQQGSRGGPSNSWQETMGRIAQQLAGAYIGRQDSNKQNQAFDAQTGLEPDSYSLQPTMNDQQIMESPAVQNILQKPNDAERMQNPNIQNNIKAIGYEQDRISQAEGRNQSVNDKLGSYNNPADAQREIDFNNQSIAQANQNIDSYGDQFNRNMGNIRGRELTDDQRADRVRTQLIGQRNASMEDTLNEKMNPRDYSMQQLRGLENNPYAKRILAQMMMQNADRDYAAGLADTDFERKKEIAQLPMSREQVQQKKDLLKPTKPKTVKTAEGVFVLNDDGSLGTRLGNPHSDFMNPLDQAKLKKLEREKTSEEKEIKSAQIKDQDSLIALNRKTEMLDDTIERAKSNINWWSTGAPGTLSSIMPNETDRSNLDSDLLTLKANLGFDSLQQMRDNSKTGGALGNVSENENLLLQAINGALDPKNRSQLEANLNRIKALYPQVLKEKENTYLRVYGEAYNPTDKNQNTGNTNNQNLSGGQGRRSTDKQERRSTDIPEGVSKEQWGVMSPEQKALFK